MLRSIGIGCGALLTYLALSLPVLADGVTSYQVDGYFTVAGNNICSGPCTETVDFSFTESITAGAAGVESLQISDSAFAAYGVLGNLSGPGPASIWSDGGFPTVEYFLGPDELDLVMGAELSTVAPPSYEQSYIYWCASATCIADFTPGNISPDQYVGYGTGVVRATLVPEPSTAILLLSGVVLLALLAVSVKFRS